MVDLRLLAVLGQVFDDALPSLIRAALGGFALALSTGLLLVSVRIGSYAANPAFVAKMAILLTAGANALALRIAAKSPELRPILNTRQARLAGGLSIVLWVAAVFSGRWIAFL
ncbi:hypothetical protein GCM10010520_15320 [Rhizobium viscosum]|uniref:Copper resistance protein D domain-containing protein n=1 Tax=Rhizobium viscosum TaxID=1673 RepID=A0ABR9IXW0_RHIVS|nr:hypothetical protein [Rhizobium viscosum]